MKLAYDHLTGILKFSEITSEQNNSDSIECFLYFGKKNANFVDKILLPRILEIFNKAEADANRFILRIEHEIACPSPLEDRDGVWKIYSFNPHERGSVPSSDYFNEKTGKPLFEHSSKFRNGLAFPLQNFQHSEKQWRIGQLEEEKIDGVAVWEEPISNMGAKTFEDRRKDLQNQLNEYNLWLQGDCYFYCLENGAGEVLDSCGGFIGEDSLLQHLRDELPLDKMNLENTTLSGDMSDVLTLEQLFSPSEVPT